MEDPVAVSNSAPFVDEMADELGTPVDNSNNNSFNQDTVLGDEEIQNVAGGGFGESSVDMDGYSHQMPPRALTRRTDSMYSQYSCRSTSSQSSKPFSPAGKVRQVVQLFLILSCVCKLLCFSVNWHC